MKKLFMKMKWCRQFIKWLYTLKLDPNCIPEDEYAPTKNEPNVPKNWYT